MRRTPFMSAAALLFIGTTALAQAQAPAAATPAKQPNFSGKWTILPDTSPVRLQGMSPGGGDMGGLAEEAVIVQDDKTIKITRATPNMGEFTSIFNLDGTETFSTVTVQGQAIPLTLKSRWDGNKFIMSTWANVGQTIEIIMVFSLDATGNLVTEHTFPDMGNGGGTLTTKYKKN